MAGLVVVTTGFVVGEPGFVVGEPGFVVGDPGFVVGEPGFVVGDPGLAVDDPGFVVDEPGFAVDDPEQASLAMFPLDRTVRQRIAPLRSASGIVDSKKLASVKLVPTKLALSIVASRNEAPLAVALIAVMPFKFALSNSAPVRLAPVRSAPVRSESVRSAPTRLAKRKLAPGHEVPASITQFPIVRTFP